MPLSCVAVSPFNQRWRRHCQNSSRPLCPHVRLRKSRLRPQLSAKGPLNAPSATAAPVRRLWMDQRLRAVRDLAAEILSWCQLCFPLALFACCSYLFRGSLIDSAQFTAAPHSHAVYASVSKPISSPEITWTDVLQYKFQQIMSMQMFGKLTAVIMAAAPIVIVGGLSFKFVTGDRLRHSMYKAYTIMGDLPGADAVEADNPFVLFIGNLIFFAGMFTVAVTLGIVCDDISSFVSEVRHGNYQMVEEGHTVILNVNPLLGPVLRQIAEAAKERSSLKCPIVILADVDKDELEEMVAREAEGLKLRISTRRGCTHDAVDLKRVAAGQASCVIWLEPEDNAVNVAATRACAIASIKALGTGSKRTAKMVVQTSHNSLKSIHQLTDVPMAFRTPPLVQKSRLDVMELYEQENFNLLLAQCTLQPGLSGIISELLQHSVGKEFYLSHGSEFGGSLYSDARHQFGAPVCGIFTPPVHPPYDHGNVHLNPPDETVLKTGERLILLCDSAEQATANKKALPPASDVLKQTERRHVPCWSKNLVVLCFGKDDNAASGVLEALGMFAPEGTHVTVVASHYPERKESIGNCTVSYIEGNPASFKTLIQLNKHEIDSIVLAGLEDLPAKIADAQLVSSLIQIQEVANAYWEDKKGFNVVSPLNFKETKQVADHLISEGRTLPVPIGLDVLLPGELSSGILVQVAGAPFLDAVFKDLVNDAGSEIYLRDAAEFDLVGKGSIKAHEVADVVRKHRETFLGILKRDKSFEIAPDAMEGHEYEKGESLVVLAKDFEPEQETPGDKES